jgi:hypothetical protein
VNIEALDVYALANLVIYVGIFWDAIPQYDEADLNKSQKSRPKTRTASKVIS